VPVNATVDELDNIPLSEVQGFKEPALPWYSDQALPFDITVAAANEYGAAASAKLFGVEILNEGFGSSVDDSVLEMQATFVARSVQSGFYGPSLGSADAVFTRARARGCLNATIENHCRSRHQKPYKSLSNDNLYFLRPGHMAQRNGRWSGPEIKNAGSSGGRDAECGRRFLICKDSLRVGRFCSASALPALAPRGSASAPHSALRGAF